MAKRNGRLGSLRYAAAMAALAAAAASMGQGGAAARPTPPSEPAVKPIVSAPKERDTDGSKIDDKLEKRAQDARAVLARSTASKAEKSAAQSTLESTVTVELVFGRQITQEQIDRFLKAGGTIDHVFQSVSYGWIGTISLGQLESLPTSLGSSLLGIVEPAKSQPLNLDIAGRNGRVRPTVWDNGYDGDPNITIAILDTGVDGTHTDFSGRQQLWYDATGEGDTTAVDHNHHGSHVAGIATGSGAASGSGAITLNYTVNGTLPSSAGLFSPAVVAVPAGMSSFNWTSTMRWDTAGGGTGIIGHTYTDGAGAFGLVSSATSGTGSPISETNNSIAVPNSANTRLFSTYATWDPIGSGSRAYSVQNSVTYNAGDSYNAMRGVAPASKWAGYKVFKNDGTGLTSYTDAALDHLVTNRSANNMKVANLSLGVVGDPGINTTQRNKVNTAAANGVVVVVAAGNDGRKSTTGQREIDDPGRAHYAITVGASSPINQLTNYSSAGFAAPGDGNSGDEDRKPDLAAPGGSDNQGLILAADSNANDDGFASDGAASDYTPFKGTSMASPFIAGCAALVIDALQQSGVTWDFTGASGEPLADVMKVKQLLLMTASESNNTRESGSNASNPTLNRGSKDSEEGYGVVNADAAVDAVRLSPLADSVNISESSDTTFGSGATDKRVWARRINLTSGKAVNLGVSVTEDISGSADFDAYIYRETPDAYGNPVILASSTGAGTSGTANDETLAFTPADTQIGYLVVKRASGSGKFSISGTVPVSISHFAIY